MIALWSQLYVDRSPKICMRKESVRRVRWLQRHEAQKILNELPEHLADMMIFTLATGLRQANVKALQWKDVDLQNLHAWVSSDNSKSGKAIAVPLNKNALQVLNKRQKIHPTHVFTYRGNPIREVNTRAWRNALRRANIEDFRWHDLRHTWASWHIQNGTSLQELQMLGGWSSIKMVLRYAHLSSQQLQQAASRVCEATNWLQPKRY